MWSSFRLLWVVAYLLQIIGLLSSLLIHILACLRLTNRIFHSQGINKPYQTKRDKTRTGTQAWRLSEHRLHFTWLGQWQGYSHKGWLPKGADRQVRMQWMQKVAPTGRGPVKTGMLFIGPSMSRRSQGLRPLRIKGWWSDPRTQLSAEQCPPPYPKWFAGDPCGIQSGLDPGVRRWAESGRFHEGFLK